MKKIIHLTLLFFFIITFLGCNDRIEESWEVNTPIYMSYDDLRTSFKVAEGQDIIQSGKLYFKGRYIFVNEYQKGIHIIDNYNPRNPKIIKFIEIPGNVDLAIAGDILYADSYVDLLSIDISDINNIKEVDRDLNVFPYIIPDIETGVLDDIREENGVIIGYNVTTHTEEIDTDNQKFQRFPMWESDFMVSAFSPANVSRSSDAAGASFGTGGSMARFTLYDNYLYAVNSYELKLFNISELTNPQLQNSVYIGWEIETIFPYEDKLFIGSQAGMYIYSVSTPSSPEYISEFRHANACDPVVVDGDYAYVTLRGGNLCGAIESQLDVIDISDIQEPELVATYSMEEPYGLGIDSTILFVCDGDAGLKIYDAENPLAIDDNQLAHYTDINAFDVIPLGKILLMIGIDGLYQYDYKDPENISQLSYIPVYGE